MDEERPPDEDTSHEVVTITTAVTPVIVKAISTNSPELKTQRPASESVLVIAQNPQVKPKLLTTPHFQLITTQPVIVKNTNSIIVQNYNRNIASSQSVIKSTKSEEWKLTWSTLCPNSNKIDGDVSNDSCSILTTASDNSMDSVMTTAGSSQNNNEKTETWSESSSKLFDDNEDSRDSKTEDLSSNASTSQKEISRDARNKAEKQRRDKLNRSINELSTIVPLVTESSRKIDKTGVLRLTAHELRKEYVFGDSMSSCERDFNPGLINAFIDLLEGCLITTTCKGIIIVISPNVEKYLGHCQTDLLGTNLLNLCHPDDVEILKTNLMPHVVLLGARGQLLPNTLTAQEFAHKEKQRNFHVRLARAVPRSEPPCYDPCRIIGFLRRADKANTLMNPPVRRQRQRNEEVVTTSGNDVVFVGVIHPMRKQQLCQRLLEASKEEYKTRHLTDGRIVCCDQRISLVAGYLTSEINGVSAFTFMHKDDVRWVIIALRQMYDSNKQYGESCYRLVTKSGEFIYMRTTGYLEIGSDNDVQSFICLNTRLSEDEGKHCISKMKRKYEVIFDGLEDFLVLESNGESSIEDPVKLEQAIVHLITNLPSTNNFEEGKNKPLSIITPQLSSVKLSIEKSFSVLGKSINSEIKDDVCKPGPQPSSSAECISPKTQENSFPSNTYLVDVVDKMDLFNEKKDDFEASTYFNDPLCQLVAKDNMNEPTNSPKVYHTLTMHSEELKLPLTNETPLPTNIINEEMNLPSTSATDQNNQDGILYPFNIPTSSFVVNSLSFCKNNESEIEMQNAHPVSKSETVNNGDPLIGSIINNHDELEKFVTFGSFGAQKRSMIDNDDSVVSKRKVLMNQTSDMINVCDTIFPTCFSDNINDHITRNNDAMPEGFDQFIDELTDPTSDLGVVVPRSLVALETSITDLDDTVTQINPIYPVETDNYADIMDHHSQNKNILENIQNEHKTSTVGGLIIKKDSNDEY